MEFLYGWAMPGGWVVPVLISNTSILLVKNNLWPSLHMKYK